MNLVPSEGDLADGAGVVLIEAVEAGLGGDRRDEVDGGAQREGFGVDVDAAGPEAVADEVLKGVVWGTEPATVSSAPCLGTGKTDTVVA